ncbi:MAG: crosslink repair DNA glycosylase YcaQ family protein [bacterium]
MDSISNDEARRITLTAQGFAVPRPRKPGAAEMKRVIDRLRLIQIDSVNVMARAHYMPFFSRLGPYPQELLEQLAYREQHVFEQWAHEACFVPIEDYPLLHHQMEHGRRWGGDDLRNLPQERLDFFASVLEQVRQRGPVVTGEMETEGKRQGWWGWSHAKIGLEYNFAHGLLAVKERRNFARVYDVAERVFSAEMLAAAAMPREDAQRQMLRNSLRALGVATAADLKDYYRLKKAEVMPRLAELVDSHEAVPVSVEGWRDSAFMAPGATAAPAIKATALLSPFDNLIWDRARTERMFGFFYRIEIYTPAEKRIHGYYVLPFMHNNNLAARVDLKANRQANVLEVKAAHLEPGATSRPTARALARELREVQRWLHLDRIDVAVNGSLAPELNLALSPRTTIPADE